MRMGAGNDNYMINHKKILRDERFKKVLEPIFFVRCLSMPQA